MDYPKSVPNVGLVNGKFVDENTATGQVGSLIPSAWGNAVTDEMLNVIRGAGIAPNETKNTQLGEAIRALVDAGNAGPATEDKAGILKLSTAALVAEGADDSTAVTPKKQAQKLAVVAQAQVYTAFTTTGTASAYKLAPVPAVTTLGAGLRFSVTFHVAAGAAPTVAVSAQAAKRLMQYDGTGTKVSATVAAGQVSDIVYDGADFVLMSPLSSGQDPWALQPIGVPFPIMFGAAAPPTNKAYRYILLTYGDPYNAGALTGEVVTGVAPMVVSYARISVAGSPISGNTVYLINTERRSIRPGQAGSIQDDAVQNITGKLATGLPTFGSVSAEGAFGFSPPPGSSQTGVTGGGSNGLTDLTFDASKVARTSNETRTKNIGANFFMRVL